MLLLSFGTRSNADDVVHLLTGETAPFSGFLFPPDKERELRLQVIDCNFDKRKVILLEDTIKLYEADKAFYEKRLELFRTQNDTLAKRLEDNADVNGWHKVLYFTGGAVITGLLGYGIYTSAVAHK